MANRRERSCDVEDQEIERPGKAELSEVFTNLGIKIKKAREDCNITQEELAHLMGYQSSKSISRYEKGRNQMGVSTLLLFSEALKTSPNSLLEDSLHWSSVNAAEECPSGYTQLTKDHKKMVDEMIKGLLLLESGEK